MSSNRNKGLDLDLDKAELKSLIRGLDRIRDTFSAKGANTQINKIVFDAAKPMATVMKQLAPTDESNVLKKSVGRWRTKSGVRVGARYRKKDKNKGWYVHLAAYTHKLKGGSSTQEATPFLADGFESTKSLTAKLILGGLSRLVGKKWM